MIQNSIGKLPEIPRDPAFDNKKTGEKRGDLPDFEKLLSESNSQAVADRQKEAETQGGGELKIGETKSDKEFREMLEKITGRKQDKLKNKLEKDDYLNLMVTQLKYQDPTKPMENQEMATQLAQFNTVEQLLGINKLLTQMNTQQTAAGAEKLTSYLGKTVQVEGSSFRVKTDGSMNDAMFELPNASGTTSVVIKDANSKILRTLDLGTQEAGSHRFSWDGKDDKGKKVPSGQYSFSVDASSLDGKPIKVKSFVAAKVEGVANLAEGGKLETTAGKFELKDIVAVRANEDPAAMLAGTSGTESPAGKPVEKQKDNGAAGKATAPADAIAQALKAMASNVAAEKAATNASTPSKTANERTPDKGGGSPVKPQTQPKETRAPASAN